jgi:hypothetical protein
VLKGHLASAKIREWNQPTNWQVEPRVRIFFKRLRYPYGMSHWSTAHVRPAFRSQPYSALSGATNLKRIRPKFAPFFEDYFPQANRNFEKYTVPEGTLSLRTTSSRYSPSYFGSSPLTARRGPRRIDVALAPSQCRPLNGLPCERFCK